MSRSLETRLKQLEARRRTQKDGPSDRDWLQDFKRWQAEHAPDRTDLADALAAYEQALGGDRHTVDAAWQAVADMILDLMAARLPEGERQGQGAKVLDQDDRALMHIAIGADAH